ncbi:MAG: hypothetical protein N4A33_05525 [Bacteriovoracaceae bacterium]|jgi:glutathione synthase|nr:hypothetical protein [Bacteriovoracaceae bacterium]
MAHIFFIDPIEKLNTKKDSSLLMALNLKKLGNEVYLLFEKDFFVSNSGDYKLDIYSFEGTFKDDGYYIDSFKIARSISYGLTSSDTIHMRIDPPYDSRYQRYLWMLDYLSKTIKLDVLNNPLGIMKYNEKLTAFSLKNHVKSYVGSSLSGAKAFIETQKGLEDFILKPLDLYSGIGVEKVSLSNFDEKFISKCDEFGGAIIVQPFLKEVLNGEYRAIYFDGKNIGTILKVPNEGEFLTNIARGAQFKKANLPDHLENECKNVADKLLKDGVRLLAFDLLGDCITEVNVTCPGLLVEVSYANDKNLAKIIAEGYNI